MSLGKRKRRDQVGDPDGVEDHRPHEDNADLQALFRQHFEAKFRPLESMNLPVQEQRLAGSPPAGEDESSDWEGLPEDEGHGPKIIEHNVSLASSDGVPTEELKSFMVVIHPQISRQSLTKALN